MKIDIRGKNIRVATVTDRFFPLQNLCWPADVDQLTLLGYSCSGFPIVNQNKSPIMVYDKFLQSTNRNFQNKCAEQILPSDFKEFSFIYSHKFEGETAETGWLGINIKLEQAYQENYTLGN